MMTNRRQVLAGMISLTVPGVISHPRHGPGDDQPDHLFEPPDRHRLGRTAPDRDRGAVEPVARRARLELPHQLDRGLRRRALRLQRHARGGQPAAHRHGLDRRAVGADGASPAEHHVLAALHHPDGEPGDQHDEPPERRRAGDEGRMGRAERDLLRVLRVGRLPPVHQEADQHARRPRGREASGRAGSARPGSSRWVPRSSTRASRRCTASSRPGWATARS